MSCLQSFLSSLMCVEILWYESLMCFFAIIVKSFLHSFHSSCRFEVDLLVVWVDR